MKDCSRYKPRKNAMDSIQQRNLFALISLQANQAKPLLSGCYCKKLATSALN